MSHTIQLWQKKINDLAAVFASATRAVTGASVSALPEIFRPPVPSMSSHFASSADNSASIGATSSSPMAATTERIYAAHTAANATEDPLLTLRVL